ncbi:tRNA threonylcarbamoyladenosine dehydratase [uncultured Muribaculum sp.]|uniref:tRNA threonylcarbamoyladenosine dehydratase n=1 Tax=uncultured Muribaculum sp. TaxID=1918613 RepID=UPI0025EBB180|nr:tRNA threonylcarbamoyladenosine dehydratase [uncultured Muribaculum sp.]
MDAEALSRTALLLGDEAVARLARAHVLVVGVGGVGAYAAEVLARSGVGRITIIDGDTVAPSNLNRQLPALVSTLGEAKVDVMRRRILDINPACLVVARCGFVAPDDVPGLLQELHPDFVIDAIDSIAPKVALVEECLRAKVKIVSSMGAGGRTDPAKVKYADISETVHDGLAREVRHRLRRDGIHKGLKVVCSTEQPRKASLLLTDEIAFKRSSFGTVSWIPAQFGLMLGAYAVSKLTDTRL